MNGTTLVDVVDIMRLVLYNVRYFRNMGNLVRSALAFECESVVTIGLSTTSINDKKRKIHRSSVGAIKHTTVIEYDTVDDYLNSSTNIRKVAIENSADSLPISDGKFTVDDDLILGGESGGICRQLLDECDAIYIIEHCTNPIRCINVANAGSIALYNHYMATK